MKTKGFLNSSKLLALMTIAVFSVKISNAQTGQVDQTPIEERKGGLSTYEVPGSATDEYSWQVAGGTIVSPDPVAAGVTGLGIDGDPYIIPFTVGQQTIQVQWPDDDSTIVSTSGNVSVQRQVGHATVECPSLIQSMDISFWSVPTIAIRDADYEICSGDATSGPITVDFSGAPNFDFTYTITDLEGSTGAVQTVSGETGASTTIPIPANLVNTSSEDDQTYVVTITGMNDNFTDQTGDILDATFTITVHPTIETGAITSDNSL